MRILLVKTSSLGDVVHNLPVVTDLATRVPGAMIDWVVEEAFADIPRLHPHIVKVIPVALRRWRKSWSNADTWREMRAFRSALRAQAYDVVLDTQGLIKSGLITAQTRVTASGRRCGYSAEVAREALAARCYDATFTIPTSAHAVERNRWLAAAAFDYILDLPLDYGINAPPLQRDWQPRQRFAVLLTGTSRVDKLWPDADWIRLGQAQAVRGLVSVLPAGSAAERSRVQHIAAHVPGSVIAPAMSVAELASLSAAAELVVGLDSGLTHLAAALGRPTLALFGGSDPGLTGLHAGNRAVNLGRAGNPPSADAAIKAVTALI
jgi:heptosyltransferase I